MRLIILFILLSFGADAQIIRANPFYVRNVTNVDTLLLDSFTTAGMAFSVRKLRTAYTGNCLRVRRSSDNTEQDIGFVNNYIDTGSIKTFVGSSRNGFVTTWYDQSGNARNASISTAASQPKIYDSATNAITRRNSIVSLSVSSSRLDITTGLDLLQNKGYGVCFSVACATSTGATYLLSIRTNSTTVRYGHSFAVPASAQKNTVNARRLDADAVVNLASGTNYSTSNLQSFTTRVDYATSDAYINRNGTQVASSTTFLTDGNTSNTASSAMSLFSNVGGNPMTGSCSELIFYNTDQSANITSIENNINRNFSLY